MTFGITKLYCLVCACPLPRHRRKRNESSLCHDHRAKVFKFINYHKLSLPLAVKAVQLGLRFPTKPQFQSEINKLAFHYRTRRKFLDE